jgi:hypothetical protein
VFKKVPQILYKKEQEYKTNLGLFCSFLVRGVQIAVLVICIIKINDRTTPRATTTGQGISSNGLTLTSEKYKWNFSVG